MLIQSKGSSISMKLKKRYTNHVNESNNWKLFLYYLLFITANFKEQHKNEPLNNQPRHWLTTIGKKNVYSKCPWLLEYRSWRNKYATVFSMTKRELCVHIKTFSGSVTEWILWFSLVLSLKKCKFIKFIIYLLIYYI